MTIDAGMAQEMFKNYDRNYYTYEALETLLEWYDEIDPDMEFDVISICCEWDEYGETPCLDYDDLISDYGYLLKGEKLYQDKEDKIEEIIEELEERTTVIKLSKSVLVMAF